MRNPAPARTRRTVARVLVVTLIGASAVTAAAGGRPAAAEPPAPATTTTGTELTPAEASARAVATGHDVEVAGSTSPTDTVVANHSGTFTLTRNVVPVRKRVGGAWRSLDSTLQRAADGSIVPALTTAELRLPGAGGRTVAMRGGGHTLELDLPFVLPEPTLSGSTATYSGVRAGIDLQLIADEQGGFRQVLVIKDATAAADPALAELQVAVRSTDLNIAVDAAGNIATADRNGRPQFQSSTPLMWDSKAPVAGESTGAVNSSVLGAGAAARTEGVRVRLDRPAGGGTVIALTPNRALLTDPATVYPVYIDPPWSPPAYNQSTMGWATVAKNFGGTKYWRSTPDPNGRMQVGNSGSIWSHTLLNIDMPSFLHGAQINSATLYMLNAYSWSCTPYAMSVYAPAEVLTPGNADWNDWSGVNMGSAVAAKSFAHGYNSSCTPASEGFDIKSPFVNALNAGKAWQTFALIAANESTSNSGYKEFNTNQTTFTIDYNWAPNTPDQLATSPSTACAASPASAVGDGPVTLYARVSDPDGGNVGVGFNMWKTSDPAHYLASTDWNSFSYPSGSTAVFVIPQQLLRDHSDGALTSFSWKVQITDHALNSPESAVCSFRFDQSTTGAPIVTRPPSETIGQPATFTVTPPSGTTPTGYMYQLNGGAPKTVTATAGNASITVTPYRVTNTLSVTSLSAGGNIGQSATAVFNADAAAEQADQDLTGDNIPDLVTAGNHHGLPAGVWVAKAQAGTGHTTGTGQVRAATTNIGTYGNGVVGDDSPADFTGAQVITGHFNGGMLQDIFAYYPSGSGQGNGMFIGGNGDGSALQPKQSEHTLGAGRLADDFGNNPLRVANAYNGSGRNLAYPDLIGIGGDATNGYTLNYYANQNGIINFPAPTLLSTPTPAGGTDWNAWNIATTQLGGTTAMFLFKKATGALYLWRNVTFDQNTLTLTYTASTLAASGWNTGVDLVLQAADIDGSGTPDLWAIGGGAGATTATAYLVSNLTGGTGTATGQPAQTLRTAAHAWPMDDGSTGIATTVTDDAGGLGLTATGGVFWQTGDMFPNSARFPAAGTGSMATTSTSGAVNPAGDYTLSVWVKPDDYNHPYLLSQDSAAGDSTIRLYIDGVSHYWHFGERTSENGSWGITASYTQAKLGVWQHLTVTHVAATNRNTIFYNGTAGTSLALGGAPASLGTFRVGAYLESNTVHASFSGQVAMLESWNQALTRAEVTALAGNPDYVMFEGDSTNYTSGMSWKTEGATMNFTAGQLIIHQTKSASGTFPFGTGGYPNAVLTFQPDGNMVVYPQAAHTTGTATWSPNVYPYPGLVWVLQPDGNFVAYDKDGVVRWSSNSYN
ncbi:hypothetical protein [Dactylosporangium matsuzakiense]|uniref:Bulb-type lectin domain-containing protein n=2 Tax=Dactylosporangium matsuzakiense TaxID=53360 RepID=A0A9W6KLK8_9ACTN|nr:hypothetical protein [Dactylosporangium matsuzakiense]GLL03247.1 hypothetical protein GCM10017581_049910 [Dactylosporangium matsuzakiense]